MVGIVFQDAESQFTQQTVEDEIAFAMCNFGYERNLSLIHIYVYKRQEQCVVFNG